MTSELFYWIGVAVVCLAAVAAVCAGMLWGYAYLIYNRFGAILFRKGERRLSIASWHSTKLTTKTEYLADDFLIGERPFYLSYRVGKRRAFIMLGFIHEPRFNTIYGQHPEYSHIKSEGDQG